MTTPKLCHHKASQQGYVTLNGREHYLGHWPRGQRQSPPTVRANYDILISRWLANSRRIPDDAPAAAPVTVNQVILSFVPYAEKHYAPRRKGKGSAEVDGIKDACAVLTELFGRLPVTEFSPKALKQVRAKMVELNWSRNYCNKQVNRLKRMFRWAVAEDMIPPSISHGLSAVPAIRKGTPGVRETAKVKPVPFELVEATLPFMSPQVAAMVRLQSLTGARPGEIVIARGCDLDRSGPVWVYVPEHHKTEHRGHRREVYFGPRAQEVLTPWLRNDPEQYLFSPAEAERERHADRSRDRLTNRYPSHMERNAKNRKKNPKRPKGACYTADSYRMAIEYARRKADRKARKEAVERARAIDPTADVSRIEDKEYVAHWHPNQLRHSAATVITKEFGIEMAQLALGHASMSATQIYAERDREKVMAAFEKAG